MLQKTKNMCLSFFIMVAFAWFVLPYKVGYAIPAAPFIHTLTQPDGTDFKAKQWGDESCHGWETEDGYTVVFDESVNCWTYAIHDTTGELISSSRTVGKDDLPTGCFPHMRPTGQASLNILGSSGNSMERG
ncbi:MAG: hypothetical protein HZA47_09385 [Planctomycetes bacterium]|uniref:hypothetical protein n=1 Tax=Candidatus Wunengus sp. YC65 TaxID=3367701 RepID=UPI001D44384E|nr:hypothetical protein [Planctomycetota bacterium]